jgi:GMP synthase-like glutamine amidotransferase
MRVLAIVHGATEASAVFGEVVREHRHELVEWELPVHGRPGPGADAVMVFGGAQNVGEEDRYPWLEEEYDLLRGWVASGVPVLGVCLGAQTLAHATGARVARTDTPQVGILEATLTHAGARDPLLGVLPAHFEALFSNDFAFDVPADAVDLARSPGRTQAFRVGGRAWGVQWHPEVQREQVLDWWRQRSWLPKPLVELEHELDEKIAGVERDGRALCAAFLAVASG